MIMESPLSTLSHGSTTHYHYSSPLHTLQHDSANAYPPVSVTKDDDGLAQLISNLDHDISPIRKRALRNLQGKLDHGLIQAGVLSKRVDLLHRLTCWLRSPKLTEEELHLIIKFLSDLSKNDEFRKNFLSSQLDSLLAVARLIVKPDTKAMINELLQSVQGRFDLDYKGSPSYNDNTATPNLTARSTTSKLQVISQPASAHLLGRVGTRTSELGVHESMEKVEKGQGESRETRSATPREFYFNTRGTGGTTSRAKLVEFGIPAFQLHVTDRRVLASASESILSKDEQVVFMTTCFVRDVLLNDFPAEIFIQESSLSLGLLQAVEESWNNPKLNYAAYQTLLKLSSSLRSRFTFLNMIKYYDPSRALERNNLRHHRSGMGYHSSRQSSYLSPGDTGNDYFMANFAQFLRGLIRGLNFKSSCTNLWVLLNSFSLSFCKCCHLFGNSSTLSILVQEILLELSQFFLKYSRFVNPPVLATTMTCLLSCLQDGENIILSTDIRHAIWSLAAKTNLRKKSPKTFAQFIEKARTFQSGLDELLAKDVDHVEPDLAFNRVYDEWWRFEKSDQFKTKDYESDECDPQAVILSSLHAVQNATQHHHVEEGLEALREFSLTLLIGKKIAGGSSDMLSEENLLEWQDALEKFLLVEPTCEEDEFLLIRVHDLLSFLISWFEDSKLIRSWIHPKTTEKGSAILRVLMQTCLHEPETSPTEGTALKPILRSVFDFYFVLLFGNGCKYVTPDTKWEFLQLLLQIFEVLAETDYCSTACLHCVLYGLAKLTTDQAVIQKLVRQDQLRTPFLNRLVEAVFIGHQTAGPESFRNSTTISYAAKCILNLVTFGKNEAVDNEWKPKLISVLPLMWSSTDSATLSVSFQICEILTRTTPGTLDLLSRLETPAIMWTTAYSHLMNPSEVPAVRQAAGSVTINVVKNWDCMQRLIDSTLQVPKWKILEDLVALLSTVYWHENVSKNCSMVQDAEPDSATTGLTPLITPKVLGTIAKLAKLAFNSSESSSSKEAGSNEMVLRHVCKMFLRLVGDHEINPSMSDHWWNESCVSLLQVMQALRTFVKSSPHLSLVLLADKSSLSASIQLCHVEPPDCISESNIIQDLKYSVVDLLIVLSSTSGPHFEDLERVVLSHRSIIFPILIEWLDVKTELKLRNLAIEFLVKFLTICCAKEENGKERSHLRNLWYETKIEYAEMLGQKLVMLVKLCTRTEERVSVLTCCDIFVRFLETSALLVKLDFVGILIKILRAYGIKSIEISHQLAKDQLTQEEVKWVLLALSTMFHQDPTSRNEALAKQLACILHTTKITYQNNLKNSDRTLLHVLLEMLVNFTNDFPEGAHSLALTTGIIGCPSRKSVVPNSLLAEILWILQNELDLIDINPNVATVDLITPLLNNIAFSFECRNVVMKTNIPNFIQQIQYKYVKKWNSKQQHIKLAFMQFLVHMTAYPEIQSYFAKIDDAVSILIQLAESDTSPSYMMALEILRNLCFHASNRPRFLTDPEFLPLLSHCISASDFLPEIKCAAVALWALVSNCERGKVAAKASGCGISLANCISKLSKIRGNQEEQDSIKSLISMLEKIANILNTSNTSVLN